MDSSDNTNNIEMKRPSWEQHFMSHAVLAAKRSTCLRLQTGTVLVRDHRIIGEGYNGVVSGAQHCCDYWKKIANNRGSSLEDFLKSEAFSELHHEWATDNELHGEQNAILYACKRGIKTNNSDLYTVYAPCIHCAKVIVTAGIKRVYYQVPYARDTKAAGLYFLIRNDILVYHVHPNGTILPKVI